MLDRVGIIDVGVGNVGSLYRALDDLRVDVKLIHNASMLSDVDGLILPGVGAFDHGVQALKTSGLWDGIKTSVLNDSMPILGICLGMQLLGNRSDEGTEAGLGLISGDIRRISALSKEITVPNMGWCHVSAESERGKRFLSSVEVKQRFYFVHSYYFHATEAANVLLGVEGCPGLTAAVSYKHVCGFQFHPEKSHHFGQYALKAWLRGRL